jgi:integrase
MGKERRQAATAKGTSMIYKRGKCKLDSEGRCPKCGKKGSCGVYWYKFMWNGRLVRESTKQGNDKVARQMESAHRASLAKGEVGIREKKPAPALSEFIDKRFEPWAKATFEKTSPKTWNDWYRVGIRAIKNCKSVANCKIDELTSERIAGFAGHRQSKGLKVSTVNSSLRVLRRMLKLAVEWGVTTSVPKIRFLSGEKHRERVISHDEEARYLGAAPELLASIVTILVDSGMRPEECFRLRWESITWTNGRFGTVLVTHGKTAAARRVLPLSQRARVLIEARWETAGKPDEGWIFPAETASSHVEKSTVKKQHKKVFEKINDEAAKNDQKSIRPFVLYDLRHTFLTRLGESGCDVWTLARIAGHSNTRQSMRYVHPSEASVFGAMERVGGHKTGHTGEEQLRTQNQPLLKQ